MVPDLLSCIDRNAMIKDEMSRNSSRMAELTRQLAALYDKNWISPGGISLLAVPFRRIIYDNQVFMLK